MPHPDFSEQSDPWDSFAREIGAEGTDAEADEGASGAVSESEAENSRSDAVESDVSEPSDEAQAAVEPSLDDAGDGDSDCEAEIDAPAPEAADAETVTEEPAKEEAAVEPEEGAVGWNFLAEELGIRGSSEAPIAEENPADKLFADYTPTYIEPDAPSGDAVEEVEPEENVRDGFGDGLDSDSDAGEDRPKRPRRRGRRRSGRRRGGKTETERESAEATPAESGGEEESSRATGEAESDEKSGRRRRPRRRGRRGGKERSPGEDVENADVDAEADEEAGEEADVPTEDQAEGNTKEPVKHRKIPTWGEAISVVVEANIESRSKQPASKASKGRRGRSKSKR